MVVDKVDLEDTQIVCTVLLAETEIVGSPVLVNSSVRSIVSLQDKEQDQTEVLYFHGESVHIHRKLVEG